MGGDDGGGMYVGKARDVNLARLKNYSDGYSVVALPL